MKFKKLLSGVLACAMVVTSAFTGNVTTVKAAGSGSDGQPAAVSDDDANVPEPMLQFTFDNDCTTDVKGVAKATGSGTTQITKDNERENVLSLSNNGFLAITNKDNEKSPLAGKTALTISYWSKNAGGTGWAYFIKQDSAKTDYNNNQRYTAGIDTGGDVKTERFWGAAAGGRANGTTTAAGKFNTASWKQVTVVLDTDSTTIYVNGEQKGTQAGQNKTGSEAGAHQLSDYLADTSLFWIGKADWESGQFFTGYIDDFIVYDKALTAEQVKAAYDKDEIVSLTVNFKCGDEVLSTTQEKRNVSASYTYVPKTEDVTISVDGKIYVRETEQNGLTVTDPAEAINVAYKEASVATVDKTEFEPITTRIGLKPELPDKVGVTFEGGVPSEAPIEWAITPEDYAAATTEPKIINGTVGGKPVTLKLTVEDKVKYLITDYTFDAGSDGLQDASKESYGAAIGASRRVDGLKEKAIYLPGGTRGTGYVKFADDILQVGDNKEATDITISLFTKKLGDWSAWSWPMALKSRDTKNYLAIQQRGNGLTGYQAEFKVNNVAYAVDTGEQTNTDWMHLAITLDSKKHKMSFYQNGVLVGEVQNDAIDLSELPDGEGVQSVLGYSPFAADVDYNGLIDEFKIYNVVLTEGEIKTICDDLLDEPQMEKTIAGLRALTFESWDGKKVDSTKVVDDFVLPLEGDGGNSKITWKSSNEDVINVETAGKAIVTQPRGENAEDEEVTLTATVQIKNYPGIQEVEIKVTVLKLEGLDRKELRHAIGEAKEEYEAARKKIDLYSARSLTKLSTAINEAEAALENADLTEEKLTQTLAALNDARKIQFKDLDELKEAKKLIAWYPLDENAKDASGNGADGVAASSVKFSRKDGATFNGSTALQNIIKLPADKLKDNITDEMTFSFSINAGKTSKANNFFGIGTVIDNASNQGGGASKHLYLSGAANADGLTAYVTANGWGNNHKGYASEACTREAWHDVTVILKGKTITLYIDSVKKDTVNTDISLPDAWAADGTQYAYIGNCAYGHNGDLDYLGSIKDVRIYNMALEEEQIDYIAKYRAALPMTYAKRDLIAGMKELGATEDADGNYALDIIETTDAATKTLALPKKVNENKTDVTWTVEGTDAEAIDVSTGVVTIPTPGIFKEFTLKATIQVGEETETFTYNCRAFWEDPTLDKTQLNNRINELNLYKGDNYTAVSYAAFRKTLQDVRALVPTLTTQPAVTAQIGVLNAAEQSLVDISGLRSKFDELEAELVTLEENDHTKASWDALKEQMDKAEALLDKAKDANAEPAVSTNDVTSQTNALTTARTGLKACGSKESLTKAIADAKALSKYETAYTEASWSALQGALQTAEGKLNERLEDYTPAATALNTAVNNLVIADGHKLEGEVKTQLQKQLAEAKAEAQNLTEDDFIDTSWKEYQDALDAFEAVLAKDKATKDEAQDAAAAVEAARAALAVKSSAKASSAEKTSLQNAIDGVITASGDYTEESWTEYQKAKAAVDKLLERMNAEEHNVTKGEVSKAITALNTAAGNLEPTEAQKLTDDDKTALTGAVADAKALNLTYYTADSKKAYQDALADLDALSKKNNATKNEVKAAEEALATAKAGLTLTEDQIPTAEKKQEFTDAYKAETDRDLKAADYTEESWARYQAAMAAAADLSERLSQENNKVAKDEIDAVVAELKAAYEALAKPAPVTSDTDKTALNAAITAAGKLVQKTYTTSTWNAFQTALTNAKNIYAKEDATQKEIDDAVTALKAKQNALKKAVTKITITDKATGGKAPKIAAGKKVTLKAAVSPAGASSSVTWSVDAKSKKYASVSKKGVVTTKKAGAGKKATIIATAADGSKKTGKITITLMKNAVTKVTLKAAKKSVKAGKSVTVKATVKTNGKKVNKTLSWKSSNTKYATVNSKGKVTTKKAGKGKTVTITATATDGTGKKASVKIKITK